MADIEIQKHESFPLSVIRADDFGNAVRFNQIPQWLSSDETILTVTTEPDGLSGKAHGVTAGTANITVTADGLTGVFVVQVIGEQILFQPGIPTS